MRPRVAVPLAVVAATVLGAAAYLFAPWKLVVDDEVHEPLPSVAGGPRGDDVSRGSAQLPQVVAAGRLVSHEHETSGHVRVLRLADGSRVLRIEDLRTSNGPDLRVWLTDADVVQGRAGWFVFDDGRHVDLGALRGNLGSQNYALGSRVDLRELNSMSIWCRRFRVSFGAAELEPRT